MHADLGGLHRVELIVHRRGRASEIIDLVNLDIERKTDVMAGQLKARMREEVVNVAPRSGVEVVDAQDLVAARQQPFAQMRPDEPCSARDENAAFSQHGRRSSVSASGRVIMTGKISNCPCIYRSMMGHRGSVAD